MGYVVPGARLAFNLLPTCLILLITGHAWIPAGGTGTANQTDASFRQQLSQQDLNLHAGQCREDLPQFLQLAAILRVILDALLEDPVHALARSLDQAAAREGFGNPPAARRLPPEDLLGVEDVAQLVARQTVEPGVAGIKLAAQDGGFHPCA